MKLSSYTFYKQTVSSIKCTQKIIATTHLKEMFLFIRDSVLCLHKLFRQVFRTFLCQFLKKVSFPLTFFGSSMVTESVNIVKNTLLAPLFPLKCTRVYFYAIFAIILNTFDNNKDFPPNFRGKLGMSEHNYTQPKK